MAVNDPVNGGFSIRLNGEMRAASAVAPDVTLLDWLRAEGFTGTKEGCAEGDCGACTVLVVDTDLDGKRVFRSVNSCIALLPTFAGREIWTVEGIGENAAHPVQCAMVCAGASQCGFCTPGFVAAMTEAYYRTDLETVEDLHAQFDGNLCRCTGYRPIRDAALAALPSARGSGGPPDHLASALAEKKVLESPSCVTLPGGTFLRPANLDELWNAQTRFPEAVCVAGGTEVGVGVAKMHKRAGTYIGLQGVAEFHRLEETPSELILGAGVPLTDLMGFVRQKAPSLYEMFRWFASRPIRNRATLGGNLATASPIGDSAPVLMALGASLVLVSPAGKRLVSVRDFFSGYRKTALREREWITEIRVPLPGPGVTRREEFVKVSKRREMDISIVSAAFCLDCDETGAIVSAGLGFGGLAATPVFDARAVDMLVGTSASPEVVDAVARHLDTAFAPISDVRGSAEYRRALPAELWRAFANREARQDEQRKVSPLELRANPMPHESACRHVSGSARYVDDEAELRGALHVWPITSPHAKARIISLDASWASQVPGVVRVLTAGDVPGLNNTGAVRHDEPLLADGEVEFHGQIVAAVVGVSLDACRAGAERISVAYEPLPAITSLRQAIEEESFHTPFNSIERGDPTALASAPLRFAGEFAFGGQEHFYLECQAAFAEWTEDDLLCVHSSTQHPSECQAIISSALGCDRNRVVVHSPRMGGGFGGKETQGAGPAALAALAAWLTGRPCRMRLSRDQDFLTTGKRHPFLARFEVGATLAGDLVAMHVDLFSNGGWSLDLSRAITDRAMFHIDNVYYLPNLRCRGRVAKTNLPSNTAFRGFGGPQGMLVIEEIMDRLARRLGVEPREVRERNLYRGSGETNTTHYGQEIGDDRIGRIWSSLEESSAYATRRAAVRSHNACSPRFKRGLAQTAVKFGISFTHTPYNQAGALVLIYTDGSVQVNHGGTEMGQGLHTKIAAVASRELGVAASAIRVTQTRTDKIPNTSATAASSGSDLNGAATRNACLELRSRLAPVAVSMLDSESGDGQGADVVFADGLVFRRGHESRKIPFCQVVLEAYTRRISLAALGYYRTPEIHYDREKGRGRPFYYFACGSAVSEVEVDVRTGLARLLRVDILHDVGSSINPAIDRGQVEGGFVQGMGWLTSEDLVWTPEGKLLSHGASTYAIPTMGDIPFHFEVNFLPDAAQPGTIHGSKAVGEPPLMLAISVREAIRDAIASDGRSGEIPLASPATCEAIYRAIRGLAPTSDHAMRV